MIRNLRLECTLGVLQAIVSSLNSSVCILTLLSSAVLLTVKVRLFSCGYSDCVAVKCVTVALTCSLSVVVLVLSRPVLVSSSGLARIVGLVTSWRVLCLELVTVIRLSVSRVCCSLVRVWVCGRFSLLVT